MRGGGAGLPALLLLTLGGWVAPAGAQDTQLQACQASLQELYPTVAEAGAPPSTSCQLLSGELMGALRDHLWGAGDVLTTSSGASTAAGSAAQSEAVASGQPLGVGGGSLSLVGTDGGTDGITSLTVNPWVFFGGDRETAARYSRFSDLTLYFPVNDVDGDEDGGADYFGVRLRLNFTGRSAGDEVVAVQRSFEALLADDSELQSTIRDRLMEMAPSEIRACAETIESGRGELAVATQCGPGLSARPTEGFRAFQAALDQARVKADAEYFGLDLRFETGDPTLGAVPSASVNSLNAGVSFGRQFVGEEPDPLAPSSGLRLRASVRYAELTDLDETSFAFEAGGAFVSKRPIAIDQALTFSGGLELRAGDAEEGMEAQAQTDYLSLRASLNVPVTRQTAISIAFGHPVWGDEVSQVLSITGDWRLGLRELLTGGRS